MPRGVLTCAYAHTCIGLHRMETPAFDSLPLNLIHALRSSLFPGGIILAATELTEGRLPRGYCNPGMTPRSVLRRLVTFRSRTC